MTATTALLIHIVAVNYKLITTDLMLWVVVFLAYIGLILYSVGIGLAALQRRRIQLLWVIPEAGIGSLMTGAVIKDVMRASGL